jgi:hypothetical protein
LVPIPPGSMYSYGNSLSFQAVGKLGTRCATEPRCSEPEISHGQAQQDRGRSVAGWRNMGSIPRTPHSVRMTREPYLFDLLPAGSSQPKLKSISVPLWTEQKARLIAEHVRLFTIVTKHGGYIDGFAGPQTGQRCASWAASEVVRIQPPLIRHLFLRFRRPTSSTP